MSNPGASRDRIRSALFIDFDNIYLGLRDLDPQIAEGFATDPGRWVDWLSVSLSDPEAEGTDFAPRARRILVRRCYLNPITFGRYRVYFTRMGFSVVDCPPLTGQGKNSTDIQMVMDILDTLNHSTDFEEFIILSGDADFTPVMRRLRNHDRRTVMVTTGPAAQAYKATCETVVNVDQFVEQALAVSASRGPVPVYRELAAAAPAGDADLDDLAEKILAHVVEDMAGAEKPKDLASVAWAVIGALGDVVTDSKWAGKGSFKGLLASAQDFPLRFVTAPGSPGYLYDPDRHDAPDEPHQDGRLSELDDALADLIRRVCSVSGCPVLAPDEYRSVFQQVSREVDENGFVRNATCKAVRDRCAEAGTSVSRSNVQFVLTGLLYAGHKFEEAGPGNSAEELARCFLRNTVMLCTNAQMELSEEDRALLEQWLVGE